MGVVDDVVFVSTLSMSATSFHGLASNHSSLEPSGAPVAAALWAVKLDRRPATAAQPQRIE